MNIQEKEEKKGVQENLIERYNKNEDEDQLINQIEILFNKLSYENQGTMLINLKDVFNTRRKSSIHMIFEEDYIDKNKRKQSIFEYIIEETIKAPKIAIIFLIISTFAGSLVFPFYKLINSPSPYLKGMWKTLLTIFLMIPFFIYEIKTYGRLLNVLFSFKNILFIFLSQIFNALWLICQLIALNYTFSSHMMIFSGLTSLVLVFFKFIKRLPVSAQEIVGMMGTMLGALIISKDGGSGSEFTSHSIIIGDLISLLGSFFGAFNLTILAPLLKIYKLGVYCVISSICVLLITSVIAIISSDKIMFFSFDPELGLFGIFHPKNILYGVIGLGIIGTYFSSLTFLYSMKFLSTLLVSLSFLIQPIITQIICSIFGIEPWPGILTYIGGIFVLVGLLTIATAPNPASKKEATKIDNSQEMK